MLYRSLQGHRKVRHTAPPYILFDIVQRLYKRYSCIVRVYPDIYAVRDKAGTLYTWNQQTPIHFDILPENLRFTLETDTPPTCPEVPYIGIPLCSNYRSARMFSIFCSNQAKEAKYFSFSEEVLNHDRART